MLRRIALAFNDWLGQNPLTIARCTMSWCIHERAAISAKSLKKRSPVLRVAPTSNDLREFIAKHGRATQYLIAKDKTMPAHATYAHRFGSLQRAVAMITTEPTKGFSPAHLRLRLKLQLQEEFSQALTGAGISSHSSMVILVSSLGLRSSDDPHLPPIEIRERARFTMRSWLRPALCAGSGLAGGRCVRRG